MLFFVFCFFAFAAVVAGWGRNDHTGGSSVQLILATWLGGFLTAHRILEVKF